MMTSAARSPFWVLSDRISCGRGTLVIDRYADGEIVATSVVIARDTHALRQGSAHALCVLLDRLAEVVQYAEFSRPQDSVRRDLGLIRGILDACDLELDAVPGVGYRLRDRARLPVTVRIHDLMLDVAGRRVTCGGQTATLGEREASLLQVLADSRMHTPSDLYRLAWGGQPYDVADLVGKRIASLRDVLRTIGSRCSIRTWTVHTALGATTRYFLGAPERVASAMPEVYVTSVSPMQMTLRLDVPTKLMSLFHDAPQVRPRKTVRRAASPYASDERQIMIF